MLQKDKEIGSTAKKQVLTTRLSFFFGMSEDMVLEIFNKLPDEKLINMVFFPGYRSLAIKILFERSSVKANHFKESYLRKYMWCPDKTLAERDAKFLEKLSYEGSPALSLLNLGWQMPRPWSSLDQIFLKTAFLCENLWPDLLLLLKSEKLSNGLSMAEVSLSQPFISYALEGLGFWRDNKFEIEAILKCIQPVLVNLSEAQALACFNYDIPLLKKASAKMSLGCLQVIVSKLPKAQILLCLQSLLPHIPVKLRILEGNVEKNLLDFDYDERLPYLRCIEVILANISEEQAFWYLQRNILPLLKDENWEVAKAAVKCIQAVLAPLSEEQVCSYLKKNIVPLLTGSDFNLDFDAQVGAKACITAVTSNSSAAQILFHLKDELILSYNNSSPDARWGALETMKNILGMFSEEEALYYLKSEIIPWREDVKMPFAAEKCTLLLAIIPRLSAAEALPYLKDVTSLLGDPKWSFKAWKCVHALLPELSKEHALHYLSDAVSLLKSDELGMEEIAIKCLLVIMPKLSVEQALLLNNDIIFLCGHKDKAVSTVAIESMQLILAKLSAGEERLFYFENNIAPLLKGFNVGKAFSRCMQVILPRITVEQASPYLQRLTEYSAELSACECCVIILAKLSDQEILEYLEENILALLNVSIVSSHSFEINHSRRVFTQQSTAEGKLKLALIYVGVVSKVSDNSIVFKLLVNLLKTGPALSAEQIQIIDTALSKKLQESIPERVSPILIEYLKAMYSFNYAAQLDCHSYKLNEHSAAALIDVLIKNIILLHDKVRSFFGSRKVIYQGLVLNLPKTAALMLEKFILVSQESSISYLELVKQLFEIISKVDLTKDREPAIKNFYNFVQQLNLYFFASEELENKQIF